MSEKLKNIPFGTTIPTVDINGDELCLHFNETYCIKCSFQSTLLENSNRDGSQMPQVNVEADIALSACEGDILDTVKSATAVIVAAKAVGANLTEVAKSATCAYEADSATSALTAFSGETVSNVRIYANHATVSTTDANYADKTQSTSYAEYVSTADSAFIAKNVSTANFVYKASEASECNFAKYLKSGKNANEYFTYLSGLRFDHTTKTIQKQQTTLLPSGEWSMTGWSTIAGGDTILHS